MLEVKWYHQCYHWILYKSDNFYWRFFILLLCCTSTTLSNVNLEIEWNIQDHKFNSQSPSTFYLSLHFEYRYMLTIDKTIKNAFLCLTAAVIPHSYFVYIKISKLLHLITLICPSCVNVHLIFTTSICSSMVNECPLKIHKSLEK